MIASGVSVLYIVASVVLLIGVVVVLVLLILVLLAALRALKAYSTGQETRNFMQLDGDD